jgi:sec-independent protein translocase protein TatB
MIVHPTIEVATLGMWDTMIVMIMALVVFGPRRLPKIGRQIGKLMYEFRKASNDFRFQMEEEMRMAEEADRRKREEEERQRALAAAPPAQIEASTTPAETPAAPAAEEYPAGSEPDSSYSYDDAANEHYQQEAPVAETAPEAAPEAQPEPAPLRVQPPATGEPVPAASPTSRATAPPAPSAEPAQESSPAPGAPELLPSGDEAAVSHPEALKPERPAPADPSAREAGVETEPATHHG